MPNLEKLKEVAVFAVGDHVYTTSGSTQWKVTGRYWSDRQQSIVYDLVYEYNGVTLKRMPEHELSREVRSRYPPDRS